MKFITMMTFGTPKGDQLGHDGKGFKWKPMEQISDIDDPRLEPARSSPFHTNYQPRYFVHEKDVIHLFWTGEGNLPDMGLALVPLYIMNPDTFSRFKPLFCHFVTQQVHPQRTVFQLFTDGYNQRIFYLCFVF